MPNEVISQLHNQGSNHIMHDIYPPGLLPAAAAAQVSAPTNCDDGSNGGSSCSTPTAATSSSSSGPAAMTDPSLQAPATTSFSLKFRVNSIAAGGMGLRRIIAAERIDRRPNCALPPTLPPAAGVAADAAADGAMVGRRARAIEVNAKAQAMRAAITTVTSRTWTVRVQEEEICRQPSTGMHVGFE